MADLRAIPRPQRWDVPYSPEMTDAEVDRLLNMEPFNQLDPKKFKGAVTLEGILKNDARLVRCQDGDVIVREGDWGNSAFFVLSGKVRVVLPASGNELPAAALGRREPQKKNLFQALAQLWRNHREPEVRDVAGYVSDSQLAMRGSGEETRIYLQDVPAVLDQHKTAVIETGNIFGELSALGRTPRTATVFAEGEAELLEIRWQGLRDIMRRDPALKQQIENVYREHGLRAFLRACPLFQHLSEEDMSRLVTESELESYGRFDSAAPLKQLARQGAAGLEQEPVIAEEGHHPNGVILIRSGLARLSEKYHHGHRTVGYLTPGQMYGFEEIAQSWRNAEQVSYYRSLRAIGYVTVVIVPTYLVEKFVLEKLYAEGRSQKRAKQRDPGTLPVVSPQDAGMRIDSDVLEFLVENRFINGTATMLIDLDRCTRCDDCVRACAETHGGNPRFLRYGPTHGHYMVARACMHCEDPVCMIECPTGAIHRDPLGGQVVINDRTCIGCSACAKNCPYEAIRMVEIRNANGEFIRDEQTQLPIQKATKCDLCGDQLGGPACQRACPHDALARVDMRDVESLADWLGR